MLIKKQSSITDFWCYKTSFTTIPSNFCHLQSENIHSPVDLKKKATSSGSTTHICDAPWPPPAPWPGSQMPAEGSERRDAPFYFSRLHNLGWLNIWGDYTVPWTFPQHNCCAQVMFFFPKSLQTGHTTRQLHSIVEERCRLFCLFCWLHICDFSGVSLTSNCLREKRLKLKNLPLVTHFISYLVKYKDLFNRK